MRRPRKTIRKVSKAPLPKARRLAWQWFSKYIRLRDANETTKDRRYSKCCTCGRIFSSSGGRIQAGHFIPGRAGENLFDERGVHAQCKGCNYRGGSPIKYYAFMREKYGQEVIDELYLQANQVKRWTVTELTAVTTYYKDKVKEMGGWPPL